MAKMEELDFMHYCSIDSDFKQIARIGNMNTSTINSHLFSQRQDHHISCDKQLKINPFLQFKHILTEPEYKN